MKDVSWSRSSQQEHPGDPFPHFRRLRTIMVRCEHVLPKAQQDSGFTIPNRVVECGSSVHDVRTSNQIRTRIFKSLTSIPNSDNLAAKRRLLRALCSCCRLDVLDENLRSSRCSPVVAAIDFWGKAQTSSTLPGGIQQHNFRCAAESLV